MQLQAKALRMQATAVVNVVFAPGGVGPCQLGYRYKRDWYSGGGTCCPPTY